MFGDIRRRLDISALFLQLAEMVPSVSSIAAGISYTKKQNKERSTYPKRARMLQIKLL